MQETFDQLAEWTATLDETSEDALNHQVTRFVETLQAQAGGPEGYRLRCIILTNFWLYGRQKFEIPHGRLFLAGENASGKSTVLTVYRILYLALLQYIECRVLWGLSLESRSRNRVGNLLTEKYPQIWEREGEMALTGVISPPFSPLEKGKAGI